MNLKRICFLSPEGKKIEELPGLRLKILVDGAFREEVLIQPNLGIPTHARILGQEFSRKHLPLKGPEDYSHHIEEVKRQAKRIYGSNGSGRRSGLLRRGPRIEVQKSYSLM